MWAAGGIGDKIILTPSRPPVDNGPLKKNSARSVSSDSVKSDLSARLKAEKQAEDEAAAAAAAAAVEAAEAAAAAEVAASIERAAAEAAAEAAAAAAAVTAAENKRAAAALATQAKLVKVVAKQTFSAQMTTMRAIAHRAAADMERYRQSAGREQEETCGAYWQSWTAHMAATKNANDSLLSFIRGSAAGAAHCVAALHATTAAFMPMVTGEALAGGSAAAADGSGASAASSSESIVRPADAIVSRHALSLSSVAASLSELNGQVALALEGLAVEVSRDVCGDPDGPLGRKGDGKHIEPSKSHPHSYKKGEAGGEFGATPRTIADLCALYEAVGADIMKDGAALVDMLTGVGAVCSDAYISFESMCHGLLTGSKLYKGKDLWAEELRYRRACRALLAAKARYLAGMAVLFERYRKLEQLRSDSIAMTSDRFAIVVSRVFDRVTSKSVAESVKGLNTHADFCRLVEEDTRRRIDSLRAGQALAQARAAAAADAAAALAAGPDAIDSRASRVGPAAYGSYSVVPPVSAHQPQQQHLKFSLDAAPAVISPLCSPIVLRCGMLLRQTGIIKQWKQCVGVLTRDGFLHVFQTESDDLATHPDVLMMVLRFSSERYAAQGRFAAAHPQPAKTSASGATAAAAPARGPVTSTSAVPAPAHAASTSISTGPDTAAAAGAAHSSASSATITATVEGAAVVLAAEEVPAPILAVSHAPDEGSAPSVEVVSGGASGAAAAPTPPLVEAPPPPVGLTAITAAPTVPPHTVPPHLQLQLQQHPHGGVPGAPSQLQLPPPALPAFIISASAAYATNVSDLQSAADYPDLVALVKRADAPATTVYQITPHTKFAPAPSVHMHAFELSDKTGWFGSNKLMLRATCLEDAAEWQSAGHWIAEQLASMTD